MTGFASVIVYFVKDERLVVFSRFLVTGCTRYLGVFPVEREACLVVVEMYGFPVFESMAALAVC